MMVLKKKRQIIETYQEILIVCDNVNCDFNIPNETGEPQSCVEYIDKPCPKCGENLLTKEDYLLGERLKNTVDWVNKWFSWILYLNPFYNTKDRKTVNVKVHKGIHVKEEE